MQDRTDLRPWGWAPGDYSIRCVDCAPEGLPINNERSGDKRCWRCEPCARKAMEAEMAAPDQTTIRDGIKITDGGPLMLPGHAVWMLRGKPVWMGALGQPVEDLEYDEMVLHATDIARLEGVAFYGRR